MTTATKTPIVLIHSPWMRTIGVLVAVLMSFS